MEMLIWNTSDVSDRGLSKSLWRKCPLLQYSFGIGGTLYYDDFINTPASLVDATAAAGYLALLDESCTAGPDVDAPHGVLDLITAGAANDFAHLTLRNNTGGMFRISDTASQNKKVWFETRFKVDVVANTSFYVGALQYAQLADGSLTSAFIDAKACLGMLKLSGGANADIIMNNSAGAEVVLSDDFATPAADTWYKYGFYYDGMACFQYLNGVIIPPDSPSGAPYNATKPATTDFPDAIYMTPVWSLFSADAAAKKMSIDYVAVAVES